MVDAHGVPICFSVSQQIFGSHFINLQLRTTERRAIREKKAACTGSKFKELVPEFIYSVINGLIYQNCIVGLFTAVQVIITADHANFDVPFNEGARRKM